MAISTAEAAGKADTGVFQMGDARQKHQRASFRIARETGAVKKKKDLKIFSSIQFYPSIPKGRAVYLHVESKSWKRVPFPTLI